MLLFEEGVSQLKKESNRSSKNRESEEIDGARCKMQASSRLRRCTDSISSALGYLNTTYDNEPSLASGDREETVHRVQGSEDLKKEKRRGREAMARWYLR
jgi:hypothetical protein